MRDGEPLSQHTTFRIGGPVDVWAEVHTESALRRVIQFCDREHIDWWVFGRGSNVLVSDQGLRGVGINLSAGFAGVRIDGKVCEAGAGAALDAAVDVAEQAGWSGLEFLAGIPGTFGGALATNAGAVGRSLADVLATVQGVDANGNGWSAKREELSAGYRQPLIPAGVVATRVSLRLAPGEPEPAAAIRQERWTKHPHEPSAGSYFKNPVDSLGNRIAAGRLIEQCGLKGESVGGAAVSGRHANFIINTGGARFADVYELAELVKARVEEQTGIRLQEEVRILPGSRAEVGCRPQSGSGQGPEQVTQRR